MTIERVSFPEGLSLSSFGQPDTIHDDLMKTANYQTMLPGKHLVAVPVKEGAIAWVKEVHVHLDRTATITTINTVHNQGKIITDVSRLSKDGDMDFLLANKNGEMCVYEVFRYRKDNVFLRLVHRISDMRKPHPAQFS